MRCIFISIIYLIRNYVVFRKNVSIIFCANNGIYIIIEPIIEISYGTSFVKFICISVVSRFVKFKYIIGYLLHNNIILYFYYLITVSK